MLTAILSSLHYGAGESCQLGLGTYAILQDDPFYSATQQPAMFGKGKFGGRLCVGRIFLFLFYNIFKEEER